MDLIDSLKNAKSPITTYQPTLFNLERKEDYDSLSRLIGERMISTVIDDYEEQLREYFALLYPPLSQQPDFEDRFQSYLSTLQSEHPIELHGIWAYYPWLAMVVHILPEDMFFKVRTARNRNLITEKEQEQFYDAVIGVAGQSVGNSVTLAIILTGGAKRIKIADHDSLALSNLNRIRAGVDSLGIKKVYMTARQIYLLNPYAQVEVFPDGLNDNNIDTFFVGANSLDLMVDEIDNLAIKCRIREYCQKHRVPLLMAADSGDNGVIDVERYDMPQQPPFFHGRLGDVTYEQLAQLKKYEIGRLIGKHVGSENIPERMYDSLAELGKALVSWPQLGTAATLNGAAIAYAARKIVTNASLIDNRSTVNLDEKLDPMYAKQAQQRQEQLEPKHKQMLDT